ncbi:hypothetical protein EI94DRAFT_1808728 [Lactarius quietus]|nr:hypothetical protein EI94DRAFT_1808728 [Lactarius quietus]
MAFFARPQSASAAVKIVAPSAVSDDPRTSPKKDSTQRQCRNILIYGLYLFSPPASNDSAPTSTPQPETPTTSAKLSQAVNAPVFVPRSSSLPPASPTLSRAQAQTPPTASTLSTSPPATEYDEHDPYDPNYYISSDNNGLYNMYTAETVVPQMQALDVNPYDKLYESQFQPEYDQTFEYYPPQSTFIRQPVRLCMSSLSTGSQYLMTSSLAQLPLVFSPSALAATLAFHLSRLHADMLLRSEIIHTAPAPGLNLPDELQVTIRSSPRKHDRLSSGTSSCVPAIEQWSQLHHPNIVSVQEAFTTRSFGDHSLVVAYTYYPNAQTLYDAHIKPRPPTFVHGRLQAALPHVPERTLWSYIIQIAGAMKAATTWAWRSCGLADVLTYNPASPPRVPGVSVSATQIQEDLVMFGKLIMALCCNNVAATSNFAKSLEVVTQHYSADLKNVALFCLSKPGVHKHIGQLFDMIGSRLLTEMDDLQNGMDFLEGQLMSELENARLVRLLTKFGFINERPEFARDSRWSETGDRYIIKLFRDYVFHQVDDRGRPVLSLSHVLSCLNKASVIPTPPDWTDCFDRMKLDAGTDERVMLVSRDEQSVLVVSYKDIKACVASAYLYVFSKFFFNLFL